MVMTAVDDHPIVVGVDGSDESLEAVRWAAVEAGLRGRAVLLINAYGLPTSPEAVDPSRLARLHASARAEAGALTSRAASVVRELAPQVAVVGQARIGPAAHVLIELSGVAAAIVVGHRGRDGFGARLLGSVAARVAAHAQCPVAVVRPAAVGREITNGVVLVGTDGSSACDVAVGFAFEEADLRGGAVSVIHAWEPPAPPWRTDVRPLVLDAAEVETAEEHRVREWIRPWQDKYPQVPVQVHLSSQRPAAALLDAASRAELLVVGSRGHGGFAGLLLGSVSQQVIHHAPCPVVVAR
jgi:nucleotide-binding universal stress UspA family protein